MTYLNLYTKFVLPSREADRETPGADGRRGPDAQSAPGHRHDAREPQTARPQWPVRRGISVRTGRRAHEARRATAREGPRGSREPTRSRSGGTSGVAGAISRVAPRRAPRPQNRTEHPRFTTRNRKAF